MIEYLFYSVGIIVSIFFILSIIFSYSLTVNGAIAMALGILINASLFHLQGGSRFISILSTVILLCLVIELLVRYALDAWQGVFFDLHVKDPVSSFAVGTWVAGISITIVDLSHEFPGIRLIALILFFSNLLLWSIYLGLISRNYMIFFSNRQIWNRAHGVLLLSCVATQSIGIALNSLFGRAFPIASEFLIILGIAFYLFNLIFLFKRIFYSHLKNLTENWPNTNCILHGAVSITGLSCIKSGLFSEKVVLIIWLFALILFSLVEAVEVVRGVRRVWKFGWLRGVFIYHPTQWARNFTFGMFLAFTLNLSIESYTSTVLAIILPIHDLIIRFGTAVVIILFLIEATLFFLSIFKERPQSLNSFLKHNIFSLRLRKKIVR